MVKLSSLLLLVPFLLGGPHDSFRTYLNTEDKGDGTYRVTCVKDDYKGSSDIRIYRFDEKPVDEIADTAFVDTTFTSIVISKDITKINDAVFTNAPNIQNIYYTGSLEDFAGLNLSFDTNHVFPYSVDEGFIYYWNTVIRPTDSVNLCHDTDRNTYKYVLSLYNKLTKDDLDIVNAYEDAAGAKIGDSMKELINYYKEEGSQKKNDEWNQTGAITLIIVIAVIGTTSIAIFFLLKTKNIIE